MFQSQIHSIENVLHLCFHSEVEAWGLLSLIVWDAEPAGWLCWFRQSRLDTAGREDTAGLMEISCAILQAAPLSVGQRVSSPDCNIISTPTSTPTSLQCNTSSQSKTIKPPPAQSRTAGLKKGHTGVGVGHITVSSTTTIGIDEMNIRSNFCLIQSCHDRLTLYWVTISRDESDSVNLNYILDWLMQDNELGPHETNREKVSRSKVWVKLK